jgi:hypothetical protein
LAGAVVPVLLALIAFAVIGVRIDSGDSAPSGLGA